MSYRTLRAAASVFVVPPPAAVLTALWRMRTVRVTVVHRQAMLDHALSVKKAAISVPVPPSNCFVQRPPLDIFGAERLEGGRERDGRDSGTA